MDGYLSLLRSRKVLLAALGALQTIVLAYFNVDPKVWAAIDILLVVVIDAIGKEDAAAKSAPTNVATGSGDVTVTKNEAPQP